MFIFRQIARFFPLLAIATAHAETAPRDMRVDRVYQTYCASCHGAEFQGGLGGSLVDGDWKHGSTDADIFRSIQKGNMDLGMTPWEGILSDEQIRALVILLREKEKEHRDRGVEFPKPRTDEVTKTQHHAYRTEVVADGLDIPWSIAFMPDGRYLVAERPGPVRFIDAEGTVGPPIEGTPQVIHHGQGGMMEVALHPEFAENGWVYLAYSDGTRDSGRVRTMTTLARGKIVDNRWTDHELLWRADDEFYGGSGVHFGTRIVFRGEHLFFVVGERGGMMAAQKLDHPVGKIYRIFHDGGIPEDNPFADNPDAIPGIWSYGHRNPQGLVFDPRNGDLYSTEHGPRGGDEFNWIRPGLNYGWPVITHGMNYNGTPITGITEHPGMEQPVIHWTPSIAACGLDVATGEAFPNWRHDFFAGGLATQEVRRVRVVDREVVEEEVVVKGGGRVRDVRFGPGGHLYLALNDPHRIVRLVPAD